MHQLGNLAPGQTVKNAGPLGTTFEAQIVKTVAVGEFDGIVARISGNAQITGYHQFVVDDADPFPEGFLL